MKSRLVSRNIVVNGHRTSIRLEEASWDAIEDICRFEGVNLNTICSAIDQRRTGSSRTAAVRAFIIAYFREIVAESGRLPSGQAGKMIPELRKTN